MMRCVVLTSLLLGACTVGEVPIGGDDDGSGSVDVTAVCTQRVATPATAHDHAADGTNPAGPRSGIGCVTANCHAAGQTGAGATAFAFGGTIYKSQGATPVPAPGVTVHMFKAADKVSLASAVTDSAGNFVIRGTYDAFPYQTLVSGCGPAIAIRPMVGVIAAANDRNCSSGSCHAVPGGGAGAAYLEDQ